MIGGCNAANQSVQRAHIGVMAVALLLWAGCNTVATKSDSDRQSALLAQQSREVDQREAGCISEAESSSDRRLATTAASLDGLTEPQILQLTGDRNRDISDCQKIADQKREELSSRERAQYEAAAQSERERNSLMMILTASRPH